MQRSEPSETVGQAVDHDVSAGIDPGFGRSGFLLEGRIRDMERSVESTTGIPAVENVGTFGSLVISSSLLRPNRFAAQRDLITFQDCWTRHQGESALMFHYDKPVGPRASRERKAPCRQNCEQKTCHQQMGMHIPYFTSRDEQ